MRSLNTRPCYPCIGLVAAVVLAGSMPGFAGLWPVGREVVRLEARPFELQDVRLLEGPFREAMERTRKYLHELDENRLLFHFRETAGLPAPGEPLGGWEKPKVRSHAVGHYLSACAMMVASTGDKTLRAKAGRIVAALAECQKAHGNGFLGAYPQSYVDELIAGKGGGNAWYRFHKVFSGLIDVHVYCGNPQALQVAEQMAAWTKSRLDRVDRPTMQRMLNSAEEGGMTECLATLYGLTGDQRWLELSKRFDQDSYSEPLARGEDRLKGQHVNSIIPNIIGNARLYEVTGAERDRQIAEFFWNQVVGARSYCTGGTSLDEFWKAEPGKLSDQLGGHNQETCCTYNLLKLTRHLFAWKPDRKFADYYERALLNGILATQDPKTGMMMYYFPLASGFWKYFNAPPDTFWCCVGTGMENHARYGESIYFHDDAGIWVNLFIASELNWKDKHVRLRQETRFPDEQRTAFSVKTERPVRFALRLRVPQWVANGVAVRVNGNPLDASADKSGYLVIDRTWADGDRVEMALPMQLRAWPMPDDPTLLAVMYGPMVLGGRLGTNQITDDLVYRHESYFKYPKQHVARAPDIVTANPDPAEWVKPVAGEPLTFRTQSVGRPRDVTLVPLHRLWGEPYAVYWRVVPELEWQKREVQRKAQETAERARDELLKQNKVDEVIADGPFGQSEKAHAFRGERTHTAPHQGRSCRCASNGWFGYTMKTLPNEPMALLCTYSYWGGKAQPWTFDIVVDDTKIAAQTLDQERADRFFDVKYAIPPELTRGKSSVVVKFAATPGQAATGAFLGGVFDCVMLKAKPTGE
ncbi:MAG: glycoside hydrolase family 127 protein [Verrucomicrobia bacterium]|nr:glycoside hydrolase family 127 protein [Verrucomicrobiota bacterium]